MKKAKMKTSSSADSGVWTTGLCDLCGTPGGLGLCCESLWSSVIMRYKNNTNRLEPPFVRGLACGWGLRPLPAPADPRCDPLWPLSAARHCRGISCHAAAPHATTCNLSHIRSLPRRQTDLHTVLPPYRTCSLSPPPRPVPPVAFQQRPHAPTRPFNPCTFSSPCPATPFHRHGLLLPLLAVWPQRSAV